MRVDHSTAFPRACSSADYRRTPAEEVDLHKLAAFSANRFRRVAKKYDVSERWPCTTTRIENREASLAHVAAASSIRTHAHSREDPTSPGSRRASRSLPPLPGVCMLIFTSRYPSKPRAGPPRFPPDRIFARKKKRKSNSKKKSIPRQERVWDISRNGLRWRQRRSGRKVTVGEEFERIIRPLLIRLLNYRVGCFESPTEFLLKMLRGNSTKQLPRLRVKLSRVKFLVAISLNSFMMRTYGTSTHRRLTLRTTTSISAAILSVNDKSSELCIRTSADDVYDTVFASCAKQSGRFLGIWDPRETQLWNLRERTAEADVKAKVLQQMEYLQHLRHSFPPALPYIQILPTYFLYWKRAIQFFLFLLLFSRGYTYVMAEVYNWTKW